MMNRRQFVSAAAAGAAMFARIPNVFAQSYELIIKGGRVIDPSIGLDAIRDIAIAGGRIVAVEPNIAVRRSRRDRCARQDRRAGADRHPHVMPAATKEGPPLCLQDGVTGWVDAGSAGADNIDAGRGGRAGSAANRPPAGEHLAHWRRSAPPANCTISTSPTSISRAAPSRAIAMSSSASRRDCRTSVADANDLEACGARRRRRRRSICR